MPNRDNYWESYTKIVHSRFFYHVSWEYATRIRWIFNIICSASAVANAIFLSMNFKYTLVWIFLLIISQVLLAVRPLFNFEKQIMSCQYLVPDLIKLCLDMKHKWEECLEMKDTPKSEIAKLIKEYEDRYHELEIKYVKDISFNNNSYIKKETDKRYKCELT